MDQDKKLRIAFVSFEYPPDSSLGGIATYVAQAAQLMYSRGHDVEVFASSLTRNETIRENNILVHWIKESSRDDFPVIAGHIIAKRHQEKPFNVLESPEYYADGRKVVELAFDLPLVVRLHTPSRLIIDMSWPHGQWYGFTRLGKLILATIKVITNKSGAIPKVNPKQYWFEIDSVEKKFTLQANKVVALCNDMKEFAVKKWHIKASKVVLCPNIYHPRNELLTIMPRKIGKTIGYFGRLERRKGVDLWVKAIPSILKKYPDTRFRFVGKSQYYKPGLLFSDWIKDELKQYTENIELVDHVSLDEMPQQYSTVDICVFPSRWENFPNVCLEAMSAGKAVIGSRFGGMAEMLSSKEVGMLVNPFSIPQLVNAASHLLTDNEARIRMGMNARIRVLTEYNPNVIGERMEQIYNEAIDDRFRIPKNFIQE